MNKVLRCDIGLYKNDKWFLIPTIELSKTGKYFEIQLYMLCIELYFCFNIHNFDD